jgi:phenylpyruvate tautomerase PptA (4-oxalocrotonate tautomerase family)
MDHNRRMPIVDVEVVGEPPGDLRQGLARRLADSLATALSSRGTFVKLRVLEDADYAETGVGPAPGSRPVFVKLVLDEIPEGALREAQVQAIAQAVSGACRRPASSVHVVYELPARGRVAISGKLG